MRVLVTFAVDWEFKPWLRQRAFQKDRINPGVFKARIEGNDVSVILTGVGANNAVRTIRSSVGDLPDFCITSGLAGGLKREHRPGEILVAQAARAEADGTLIHSDERLFNSAVKCGAKPVGHFISSAKIVRTAEGKSRLGTSADAVEMESFAIMKELNGLGVPCVAIRSVSDSAEMDVPYDFDRALDDSGRVRMIRVLGQVVSDPRQVLPLAKLGVRSSRASTALARFLDGYTAYLAGHKEMMDPSVQHISR